MTHAHEERQVLVLYLLTDIVVFWVALSLATLARLDTIYQIDFVLMQRDRLICLGLFLTAAVMAGAYRTSVISDRFDAVYYTVIALAATGVAEFVVTALVPVELRVISRRELVLGVVLASALLGLWHYGAARLSTRFASLRRFFYVLGDEAEGQRVATEISESASGSADARYLTLAAFKEIVEARNTTSDQLAGPPLDVIVTVPDKQRGQLADMLEFCGEHCRRTFLYPTLHDTLLFHHSNLLAIAGLPLIQVGGGQLATPYLYAKRAIDVAIAGVGLLALLPVFIITTLAVKWTSPGPLFFLQVRQGKDGRPFNIIKFRSMEPPDENESDQIRAARDDARVTPVGHVIRKYKIDEIPQLINVLKGDMSLVGPRPLWQGFDEQNGQATPLWERRLAVRPGLTSLSHVLGSSYAKPADFLRYDLVYISSLSLVTDLRILYATVRIVLSGRGTQ